jgi:hypothetical protein
VIIGLGAVVAAAGAAFGIEAVVDAHASAKACPGNVCINNVSAFRQSQDARTAAHLADITLPTGVLVAGAGLFLVLQRPRLPALGLHAGSISLQGAW